MMIRFVKDKFFSNAGNPIHKLFRPVVDAKGNIDLEESGKENTDDIIQSFASSCDIQIILNRASNGDLSGLNVRTCYYGDFTDMPSTYAEFLQLQIDSRRMFEKLPIDIKQKFDNDPNKFFAQSGEKEWFEKLGYKEEVSNIEESEVKE